MNKKVLSTLEFNKITHILSGYASSGPGRKMCAELVPYEYLSDAKRALDETQKATHFLLQKGGISFGSNRDMSSVLKTLSIGGSLDMKSLCDMASFLENCARVKAYGGENNTENGEEGEGSLNAYFKAIEPLKNISDEIRRCVLSEDEISSEASAELKNIRRQTALTGEKIRDHLNRMVNSTARTYLQDPVITMRGDRFCLPVKLEYKSYVKGIVHDRSSSGLTLFIEPAGVVDLNNALKEWQLKEEKEIQRILSELSALLGTHGTELEENSKYMTLLDFIFAKAAYALDTKAMRPGFSSNLSFNLIQARHPLIKKDEAVPINIYLGWKSPARNDRKKNTEISLKDEADLNAPDENAYSDSFRILVITGPNTGGKTVTLKTAGLLTLMGEAGLLIPAGEGSVLGFFKEIYADIGDEQSIEQSLSTFSSHMKNIAEILKNATENDLCLFDELGAGTDPTEGAALACSVLNNMLTRSVSVMATTHYAEMKVFAMTTKGVKNASCEFDLETLKPTYRLIIGTPGASNAFAISKKLGIPDSVIEGAKKQMDTDKKKLEALFADLENSKKRLAAEEEKSAKLRLETHLLNERLKEQAGEMDELGEEILREARDEARSILSEAKSFADDTIRLMRKAGADGEALKEAERRRTALNERLSEIKSKESERADSKKKHEEKKAPKPSELIPGTYVYIVSMGLKGTVKSAPARDGRLTLMCGVMEVETTVDDVVISADDTPDPKAAEKRFSMKRAFKTDPSNKTNLNLNEAVSSELNLIGMNTDDALYALDKYLDNAVRAGLSEIRIVHGKGSGILRNAVQNYLRGKKNVTFRDGQYGEGDAGVTVVKVKQ